MRVRMSGGGMSSCVYVIIGWKVVMGSSKGVCGIEGVAGAAVATIGGGFVTFVGGTNIGIGVLVQVTFICTRGSCGKQEVSKMVASVDMWSLCDCRNVDFVFI